MQTSLADPVRLRVLRRTVLLDTPAERAFDRLTVLASRLLNAPMALVSLVDEERQFFKSCIGLPDSIATVRETPLSHSLCQYTVESRAPLVINDAREHPLVSTNGAVRDLGVVAYAGIPLIIDGEALGSFCVIDNKPRDWTADEIATLTALAESVMSEIDLRMLAADASRAVRERDDMLAIISHDLRNPAGLTISAIQLLRQPWLTDEQRARQFDAIERAGRRMLRLIDDLLMVSHLESGALRGDTTAIDLAAVIRNSVADSRVSHLNTGVALREVGTECSVLVQADTDRVRRVLDNLLDNAFKFTPRDGTITVTLQRRETHACILVADTGSGISPDKVSRLFERFYQVSAGKYGGAGLGLFIAHGIVSAFGGTLRVVESTDAPGTTFEVLLPLVRLSVD